MTPKIKLLPLVTCQELAQTQAAISPEIVAAYNRSRISGKPPEVARQSLSVLDITNCLGDNFPHSSAYRYLELEHQRQRVPKAQRIDILTKGVETYLSILPEAADTPNIEVISEKRCATTP